MQVGRRRNNYYNHLSQNFDMLVGIHVSQERYASPFLSISCPFYVDPVGMNPYAAHTKVTSTAQSLAVLSRIHESVECCLAVPSNRVPQ